MRKAFSVLALIAFACDFSRDVRVYGNPARKSEAAVRSDYEYKKEPRGQSDESISSVSRGSLEDRERSNESDEPVGKWRSNGEALEPKWRDGDSVPSLPFSHYRPYSRDDGEDFSESIRRPFKYRYSVDQSRSRGSSSRRASDEDDYEPTYRDRERDYEEDRASRESRRPLKNPRYATLYEETLDGAATGDGKQRGRNVVVGDTSSDDREARYREAFQARPDEYEHEFDDEEYLRPRPRKRRPPQNYEFALANEASSEGNEESEDTSGSSSRPKNSEDYSTARSSEENESTRNEASRNENALELKSLLKMQQEEGSSLSEILQRRNLTLSDLLKGKTDVINALKSRVADESDEYIEEMSRVMSNSLMKLAATVSPPGSRKTSTQTSTTSKSTAATTPVTILSTRRISVSKITTISSDKSYNEVSSNDTNRVEEKESKNTEKTTREQSTRDSSSATTPPSVSTVITTSMSPPALNSMEYVLNDDGNMGLTNDRGAKLENLDEDEIMEFSDFTDFKKAKAPAAPARLNLSTAEKTVRRTSVNNRHLPREDPRDVDSTLSIERILNTTKRIEPTKDCANDRDDARDDKNEKTTRDNVRSSSESSANSRDGFAEIEYRKDAAINVDRNNNGRRAENSDAKSTIDFEKKQTADDKNELYDKNHSSNRQAEREKNYDRALENHRGTTSGRYEELISEIEPEARAEIFELFASGSAGKRLERLLKSRNMSLEELIALRQRGSSKVHLTEVSRLKVPKTKDLRTAETTNADDGKIVLPLSPTSNSNERRIGEKERAKGNARQDAEKSINQFRQDIMSYLNNPFFDKNEENVSVTKLFDIVKHEDGNASRGTELSENNAQSSDEYGELESSRRAVQIVNMLTTFDTIPFAKDVQRHFEPNGGENERTPETQLSDTKDNTNEIHAGYVEEIAKEQPNTVDILRTVYSEMINNANGGNSGEERKTLSKVKPSIIASGAILGVTIIVFLAIFVACRIRQKQRYIYRNTFSRAVFQGPMLAARKLSNSSSLSTVMVNVVATSTAKRPDKTEMQETAAEEFDGRNDIDNDSLDANDSWETIPDYAK